MHVVTVKDVFGVGSAVQLPLKAFPNWQMVVWPLAATTYREKRNYMGWGMEGGATRHKQMIGRLCAVIPGLSKKKNIHVSTSLAQLSEDKKSVTYRVVQISCVNIKYLISGSDEMICYFYIYMRPGFICFLCPNT